jgi:hypothetical protein
VLAAMTDLLKEILELALQSAVHLASPQIIESEFDYSTINRRMAL